MDSLAPGNQSPKKKRIEISGVVVGFSHLHDALLILTFCLNHDGRIDCTYALALEWKENKYLDYNFGVVKVFFELCSSFEM